MFDKSQKSGDTEFVKRNRFLYIFSFQYSKRRITGMKRTILAVLASVCVLSAVAAKPSEDVIEGFEKGSTTWVAVKTNWGDGDKSTGVSLSTDWAAEGKQSLKCEFKTPDAKKESATYYTEKMSARDISPYDAVSFDVYNPTGQTVQCAIALTTGAGWDWYESKAVDIAAGAKQTVRVELYEGALKCPASNWQFTADLEDSDDLRRIAVKFFIPAETAEGVVYLDNVKMIVE